MQAGATPNQDTYHLLQGRRPAWGVRTRSVRLSRVHLPTSTGEESLGEVFHQLSPRDQHQSSQEDPQDDPGMADGRYPEQSTTGRSCAIHQPDRSRLDELLRAVLPVVVRTGSSLHQRGPCRMGATEIQALPTQRTSVGALAVARLAPGTEPVLRTGKWASGPMLRCKSRMRRESHVRFCEGAGVKFPRATRLVLLLELEEVEYPVDPRDTRTLRRVRVRRLREAAHAADPGRVVVASPSTE